MAKSQLMTLLRFLWIGYASRKSSSNTEVGLQTHPKNYLGTLQASLYSNFLLAYPLATPPSVGSAEKL